MKSLSKILNLMSFCFWVGSLIFLFYNKTTFFFFESSNTLIGIVKNLYSEDKVLFVIVLITTVVMPIVKFILALFFPNLQGVKRWLWKFSTADIFIVAMLVFFYRNESVFFSLSLGFGFYCFVGYWLFSLFSLLTSESSKSKHTSIL